MNKKIKIVVEAGEHYVASVKNGREFTSVDYSARNYGGGNPCDSPQEIQSAIDHAKACIKREGDFPILEDRRESLARWV